jgi:hypothetical protein
VLRCSGVVELLAARAVDIDRVVARQIGQTHGQARLALTINARAPPKICILELFVLK